MKKTIGIILGIAVIAAMVLLLAGNKKKMKEQTQSVAEAGSKEVVSTYTVSSEGLNRSFSANGISQAKTELNFMSEISGRVVAVYVEKGSRVRQGSALLKIDSELLEADYKAAKAAYDALRKDEERFTNSFEAGGVTSQQLDNIRTQLVAAESRLKVSQWKYENSVVKSPISGIVNNRLVEPGALIAPSTPLFEIVDDSRFKVICNLPESKVRLVEEGQSVLASENSDKSFTGSITHIGLKTDRGLNYPVEILLDPDENLHAGMYLKVGFEAKEGQNSLLIPRKAVVGSVLSAKVYVVENGTAHGRNVRLGEMYGDKIEILEGLEDGEKVVVSGLMNISEGSAVSIVNE